MLKYQKYQYNMGESIIKNGENGRWTVTAKPAEFSSLTIGTPEAQDIQRRYEQEKMQIKTETREYLDKEKIIHQSKELIYKGLGIDNELAKNSALGNFTKGVIDGILIGNIELAIEIINTKGKVIIDGFSHLMSIDGIKQILNIIKTNISELASGNAYERGKASAELVITALVGAGMFKGVKSLVQIGIKGTKKVITSTGELIEKASKLSIADILQLPKEARIKAIAKLDIQGRKDIIRGIIGRKVSEVQEVAIIKAHEVGMDRIGAGIGTYTLSEIMAKGRILKEAMLTREEARLLMENGVCGVLKVQESKTILDRVFGIFKGEKGAGEVISQISLQLKDQLGVIPRIVGKSLSEVNKLLKGEFEIIKNANASLKEIFKGIDINDKFLFESINIKVNEWVKIRLANIEKFVIYIEDSNLTKMSKQELVGTTNHIRKNLITQGLAPLGDAIKEQMNLGNLALNYTNKAKMLEITRRIRAVESYTIN